ncbi:MAG: hypothetical protein BWZ07_00673 [Alphaproteobacteria bacterium ADurb.BinA280]|jgi:predicted Fe-Mo cluster-binding NifX family protein|nr:hypothetical protein [Xanthomonadales bacterium]MCC6506871.1 hypothetical protein [Aquimonas sp.]OPZ13289.1 MAG: hypothetical protein BWZ07_00673 [Alphaproteobacteria bacterium ADurb.BinA280]
MAVTTVALTMQNKREITEHAGKCRNFLLVRFDRGQEVDRNWVKLSLEETFSQWGAPLPPGLDGIDALITRSAGPGLQLRLAAQKVRALITDISDPEQALGMFHRGELSAPIPSPWSPVIASHEGCGGHDCGCKH